MASEKGKKGRSEAVTVAARVEEVLRIRLDGAQFHDLREYAVEKGWGVSDTQLRRYQTAADELLMERFEADRAKLVARHVARRETLYARAVNGADYRTALAVLDSEAKILDLFPRNKPADAEAAGAADLDRVRIELPAKDAVPTTAEEAADAPDG